MGIAFEVRPPDVEELGQGPPQEVALANARRKAEAVIARAGGEQPGPVLGVDTLVSLGARIYGKPADAEQALQTLAALSGARHLVVSGVCVIAGGGARVAAAATVVEFRELSRALMEWYVAAGEWRGRAGGYAIQQRGAALVSRIEGDYLNVVGLPLATLLDLEPALLGV